MQNLSPHGEVLGELSRMGIHISMDDFGTGHSSLNYLKHFPIHRLKIDRSFVAGMTRDERDRSIVAAIISMAHNLSLRVTAEGRGDVAAGRDARVARRATTCRAFSSRRRFPSPSLEERLLAVRGTAPPLTASGPARPATRAAVSTPRARTDRIRPSSSARIPAIVQPAGVVTSSLSEAGWRPVVRTISAAPSVIWATSSVATCRGRPRMTPAVGERLDDDVDERRTARREAGHRVHVLLFQLEDPSEGREDLPGEGDVPVGRPRTLREDRHPLSDEAGGVRHRPDDRAPAAEAGLDRRRSKPRPRSR